MQHRTPHYRRPSRIRAFSRCENPLMEPWVHSYPQPHPQRRGAGLVMILVALCMSLTLTLLAVWSETHALYRGRLPSSPSSQAQRQPSPAPAENAILVKTRDGSIAWYEPGNATDTPGKPVYVYSERLNHHGGQPDTSAGAPQPLTTSRTWWLIGLIAFGFVGQLMFMSRFLLQWIISERAGRSVVPIGFWWLSLVGASILLAYFAVRMDPIGILGQLFGWPIYTRNLYMVYRDRRLGVEGDKNPDPAEHPIPDPNAQS